MNETQQFSLEETTVNGILVKDLSEASQKLFQRLVKINAEANEHARLYELKKTVIKEISDIILEEVNEKNAQNSPV